MAGALPTKNLTKWGGSNQRTVLMSVIVTLLTIIVKTIG